MIITASAAGVKLLVQELSLALIDVGERGSEDAFPRHEYEICWKKREK